VTPAGALLPPPLVNVSADYHQRQPACSSFSADLDRMLAIRHIQVPLAADDATNAVSFWIIPGGQQHG